MNKWKIFAPIMIILVLAFAFWYGGGAPGLQGWGVEKAPTVAEQQDVTGGEQGKDVVLEENSENADVDEKDEENLDEESKDEDNAEDEVEEAKPEIDLNEKMSVQEKIDAAAALAGGDVQTETGDEEYSMEQGMVINPETGKDKYLTDPVPEGKPLPVEPENAVVSDKMMTCTMSVRCDTILNNMEWLTEGKEDLVPADGVIFPATTVSFYEGESVFNVLLREMKKSKIHMEYENTPIYNSAYIEGINNLYEFDCGQLSGWMYSVNDWFPNYGCSRYALQQGDVIEWVFTCDLGVDVGGFNALGGK